MDGIRRLVLTAEFGSLAGYRAHVVAERDACAAWIRATVDDSQLETSLSGGLAEWDADLAWVDAELAKQPAPEPVVEDDGCPACAEPGIWRLLRDVIVPPSPLALKRQRLKVERAAASQAASASAA